MSIYLYHVISYSQIQVNLVINSNLIPLKYKYNQQTMQVLFQEGIEQFSSYQKDLSNRISRNQKKLIKVQKLKHDLNDPQMKRQRYTTRRTQEKNKLERQIGGMTQQEAKAYFSVKSQYKKQAKQRILAALKDPYGQQVFIDMVFQDSMNQKQNKSLAIQIQLIMKSIRHLKYPPGVHLCSVAGVVEQQLQKMAYHFWTLQSHKQDIVQVGHKLKKKLVYLSPDAPKPLLSVQSDTSYIIGGLVDRSVIKYASYERAAKLNIQSRHLPIRQFMKTRSCLNLDHVVVILSKFKQCKDWKEAFEYGAPKRWKRGQGQLGLKKMQMQSQGQIQGQEEEYTYNQQEISSEIEQKQKSTKQTTQ